MDLNETKPNLVRLKKQMNGGLRSLLIFVLAGALAASAPGYRQLAQLQFAESSRHAEMAAWYARFPIYSSAKFRASTLDHCRYFADKYRDDAQRSEETAAHHEALAS